MYIGEVRSGQCVVVTLSTDSPPACIEGPCVVGHARRLQTAMPAIMMIMIIDYDHNIESSGDEVVMTTSQM